MPEIRLRIEGMHCGSCVRRATQALQKVHGAEVQEVQIGAARVTVADESNSSSLIESLQKAGFPAHLEL